MMEPFKVDPRLLRQVKSAYPCPTIAPDFLRNAARNIIETHGADSGFDFPQYRQALLEVLQCSSFRDMAESGTGLPSRINCPKVHTTLGKPVVLELVHLTDIGIGAMALEGVRQGREHRVYLDQLTRTSDTYAGQTLRDLEWLRSELEEYPRKRLKLFLSDGSIEIQAIELEELAGIALGTTPMGTKIQLKDVEVVGGIAYLRNGNVTVIGGAVRCLQKSHRVRLYEELEQRMEEDAAEAQAEGVSPEGLYLPHSGCRSV